MLLHATAVMCGDNVIKDDFNTIDTKSNIMIMAMRVI